MSRSAICTLQASTKLPTGAARGRLGGPIAPQPSSGNAILALRNRDLVEAYVTGAPLAAVPLRELTLDLTLRCNCRCRGCVEQKAMAAARRASFRTGDILGLVPRLPELGVRAVKLYGGEPTCHGGFGRIVKALAAEGLEVLVATNGTRLAHVIDDLAGVRSRVQVRISLNAGTEASHTRIFRPPDRRPRFHDVLRNASALAARRVRVSFSMVVRPSVAGEVFRAVRLARRTGAASITLKPLIDPVTKHLAFLPWHLRDAIVEQIRRARTLRSPSFRVHVTQTLRAVLAAGTPSDLRQPKAFRTCPYTLFRAVLSPPGVLTSCPYHRGSREHVTCRDVKRLGQSWLASREREAGTMRPNAQVSCPFYCDRGAAANYLYAVRQEHQAGVAAAIEQVPVATNRHWRFL